MYQERKEEPKRYQVIMKKILGPKRVSPLFPTRQCDSRQEAEMMKQREEDRFYTRFSRTGQHCKVFVLDLLNVDHQGLWNQLAT